MNKLIPLFFTTVFIVSGFTDLNAQTRLLNKIKDKAEDKLIEELFDNDKDKDKTQSSTQQSQTTSTSTSSNNRNTTGGGLSTDIDVNAQIDDASKSFANEDFSASKFAIKQALQGIELEMGKEVLKSLPENVDGLPAQNDEDRVTSSGAGFVGLYIERRYEKGNKELDVVVANNSAWISAVNMYLHNTGYSTSQDEQYKQIQFQDNEGVVEFSESSGYKLSVPFGQTSILVIQGINYENENSFMNACNEIKIDDIKSKLGEN